MTQYTGTIMSNKRSASMIIIKENMIDERQSLHTHPPPRIQLVRRILPQRMSNGFISSTVMFSGGLRKFGSRLEVAEEELAVVLVAEFLLQQVGCPCP